MSIRDEAAEAAGLAALNAWARECGTEWQLYRPDAGDDGPPCLSLTEAGQGDGDEAERAAEGYPAEAVRAVSAALHLDACTDDAHDGCDTGDWTREAETAIAAAEPHIRAKIAAEIEAAADLDADDLCYELGQRCAARIARGEQP